LSNRPLLCGTHSAPEKMAELHIIGQIVGASGFDDCPNVFCKWTIEHGTNWERMEGLLQGQTQVDYPSDGELAVWQHPIDVHFSTKAAHGWPKLVIEVWHMDTYGRADLSGYGTCAVPTAPGMHSVTIATWRPVGTLRQQFGAFFLGGYPQLKHKQLIGDPNDRYRLTTEAAGEVEVQFGIVVKDFEKFGVAM